MTDGLTCCLPLPLCAISSSIISAMDSFRLIEDGGVASCVATGGAGVMATGWLGCIVFPQTGLGVLTASAISVASCC